jgi:hypothetical protein
MKILTHETLENISDSNHNIRHYRDEQTDHQDFSGFLKFFLPKFTQIINGRT